MAAKKSSVDEMLIQIQGILDKMEKEDLSLEESFAQYEQGMKLIKSCTGQIEQVEQKVKAINESGEVHEFQ